MVTKEELDRINFLARKKKSEGLTSEEEKEQHLLRRKYIDTIKEQVVTGLDVRGVPKKDTKKHTHDCSCGCDHKH